MATTIASGLTFSWDLSIPKELRDVSITADIVKVISGSKEYLGLENVTVTGNAWSPYSYSQYTVQFYASEYVTDVVQGSTAAYSNGLIRFPTDPYAFSFSGSATSAHTVAEIKKGQSSATVYLQFSIQVTTRSDIKTVTISFDPRPVLYGSVNGQTKAIQKLYGSVNGETKEIKKLYGSVNGQTKRIF